MPKKFFLLNTLILTLLLPSVTLFALPKDGKEMGLPTQTAPIPASWQAALDQLLVGGEAPGLMVMVKSPDWGIRFGHSGTANLKNSAVPFTENTPFRIGSVSKVFTAMVILQMEQEGLLRLDDTLDKYLKGARAIKINADKITIAQCLDHTGGIADYLAVPFYETFPYATREESSNMTNEIPPETLVAQVNEQPQHFNPGDVYANPFKIYQGFYASSLGYGPPPTTQDVMANPQIKYQPTFTTWGYSNGHYLALGLVIEAVSGRLIGEEIKRRIVDKLMLKNTHFATDATVPANIMHGYSKLDPVGRPFSPPQPDWVDRTVVTPTNGWAAGAMISSLADLITFAEHIYTKDTIINKATREKLMRFVDADFSFPHTKYGDGALMRFDATYGTLYGHGGAFPGYKTLMEYLLWADLYFVTGTNTGDSSMEVKILDTLMPLIAAAVTTPTPGNRQAGVSLVGSKLKWQAGQVYGTSYDVYLGTNPQSFSKVAVVANTEYPLTNLLPATTYYWRIDTKADKVYEGPVWSFTTL